MIDEREMKYLKKKLTGINLGLLAKLLISLAFGQAPEAAHKKCTGNQNY